VPLLWVVRSATPGRAFLWGWLFGGLAAMFHLWWVWFLIVPVEPVTRVLLDVGVVLLFAYIGLYTAVFATLVRRLGIWSAPLIWPLIEFCRSQTQIAFPWDLLGYTMTPWPVLTQLASVGGVYLVSAWLVLVNVLVFRLVFPDARPSAICNLQSAIYNRRSQALALAMALLVPLVFGLVRMRPNRPWFNVAILQPNVSPLDKGDWDSREKIQSDLLRMSREAAASHPDLLLFPETATLVDVTRSSSIGPAIRSLVDSLGVEVLTGTPLFDAPHNSWHNGIVLIRPGEDSVRQRYYKIRLMAFSEKIPYSDEVPLIRKLIGTADMGDWTRGHDLTVFNWCKGTLSGLICIEAVYPDLARMFTTRGAKLLAVVTNDGWFGRLPGAYQHTELAIMRTVENGVPMIRSANNGISFIADPYGRVLRKTRLFTQAVLAGSVPQPIAPTPYQRWGDWFIVGCLAGLAAIGAAKLAGGRKAARTS
jgi:apolipoprotein N-acyltransferase